MYDDFDVIDDYYDEVVLGDIGEYDWTEDDIAVQEYGEYYVEDYYYPQESDYMTDEMYDEIFSCQAP